MNRQIRECVVLLMIILCLTDAARAVDNYSVEISCVIPAIPGVNAPLIEEKTIKEQDKSAVTMQAEIKPKNESQEETLALIQQDTRTQSINQEQQVMLTTLYER